MAVGVNDSRYRVVLLQGILNLSIASVSVVNFRSEWPCLVCRNCPVCLSLIDGKLILPPAFLMFLSFLSFFSFLFFLFFLLVSMHSQVISEVKA